ncbi:MAG: Flp pilus assembly secretin CpaC [Pirellulaceae bacterium]|jgi:Flp pilus assembly secretin CpaC
MSTRTTTHSLLQFSKLSIAILLIAAVLCTTVSSLTAGPLEELPVTAKLTMTENEGKHILAKSGIYRLAVTDKSICEARMITPTQISLIARREGKTHVTFWMEGHEGSPSKIEINVLKKKKN